MATTIFSNALGTDRGDGGQPSFRNVLAITGGAQGQVRATFKSGSTAYVLQNVSIGIWSGTTMITTATPVELLFGGASGFNIPGSSTITSDWANLTGFTSSDKLVVVLDYTVNATDASSDQSGPVGDTLWFLFGESSYNKANPTADGSWSSLGWVIGVTSIETQAGGGGDTLGGAMQILMM